MATIIVTVALGIATLILALKLAKKRQPVWAYKTTKIIELGNNALPELKLTLMSSLLVMFTELESFSSTREMSLFSRTM